MCSFRSCAAARASRSKLAKSAFSASAGVHELDGDVHAQREVHTEPDAAHAALRDLLLEAVLAIERRACGRRPRHRPAALAGARRVAHALREAQLQLADVERLREEVVRAALEGLDDVALFLPAREHQDVDVSAVRRGAEQPTHVDARETRHVPVEDHEARRVGALQDLPRIVAVPRQHRLVAPRPQASLENARHLLVVVRRDYPHANKIHEESAGIRGPQPSFLATLPLP